MSARSFARLASPNVMKSPSTPRSILKRPPPLPLSPSGLQFSASFSIHVSPSVTSPHVHFPNSAKLVATYATHSPTTYDRTAIAVSPNPLALPGYRARVFSPTSGEFVTAQSIDAVLHAATVEVAPTKLEPAPMPANVPNLAKPSKAAEQSRASVRFQKKLAAKNSTPLPRDNLNDSLLRFPRSPYPTAPTSPAGKENTEPRVNTMSAVPRGKEMNRPAPLKPIGAELTEVPLSAAEAETAEDRLSRDFWRSVTLEEPVSAVVEDQPMSTSVPQFIFGDKDGGLWSPGMPKRMTTPLEPIALSSMLSPLARTSFVPHPQDILSPIPSDPFSSFPSFTAVLSKGAEEMITYPPRAVIQF